MTPTNLLPLRLSILAFISAMVASSAPTFAQSIFYHNLVGNPGAEEGPASPDGQTVVPIPRWLVSGNLNVVTYGTPGEFPTPTAPGPPNRGAKLFVGGPGSAPATGAQTVLVPPQDQLYIDLGYVYFELDGFLGGYGADRDYAEFGVTFFDAMGGVLLESIIGPVTREERGNLTGLHFRLIFDGVPPGTRRIGILLAMSWFDGSYNNGFADNLDLTLMVADPVEPSTWGRIKMKFD